MTVPRGSIAVYSTSTVKDAERLVVAACELSLGGEYVARELVGEQTLENLAAFSDRLHQVAVRIGIA